MAFTSFHFFVFFPVVAAIFFAAPTRMRRPFLLVAGYYFYMSFKIEYGLLLAVSTCIDFVLARRIAAAAPGRKKQWLLLGIVHNIGLLAAFKYLDFFLDVFSGILGDWGSIALLAPVGISYFTFKKTGYLIDVYGEKIPPVQSLTTFALFVSFFPAITAGPIDRAGDLVPRLGGLDRGPAFDYVRVTGGLKLMAWGFFKKVVIADRLALFVNTVFDHPAGFDGPALVTACIYFSFQIYCDFSGYTDIARGAAKVLGTDLAENFNRPYFAQSIGQFWKRWHMSLSSWLMDYLFLPIAYGVSGRIKSDRPLKIKAETWAYITGITVTMLLCGLWHGANATFVVWGGIHGCYLALSFATKKFRRRMVKTLKLKQFPRLHQFIRIATTFGLVTLAWIFFRADSMADALYIFSHLFSGWHQVLDPGGLWAALHLGLPKKELAVAVVSVAAMLLVQLRRKDRPFEQFLAPPAGTTNSAAGSIVNPIFRWCFYVGLLLWLLVFGEAGAGNFIYFRF